MNKKYEWVEVFNNIAKKLMDYRNNRSDLLDIMYKILEDIGKFDNSDDKNCNLDKSEGIRCKYDDFDPFSFMNRLAFYSFDTRKKFIELFEKKTGMEVNVPANFDGVPSVNPQLSCMLSFKDDRKDSDVDDFWNLFECALKLPNDEKYKKDFIKYYDICLNKPNCRFNLSSCLFRMNANYYISLDSTNRSFINDTFNLNITDCPNGEEYLNLLDIIKNKISDDNKFSSIADLSYQAWMSSKADLRDNKKVWLYSPGEQAKFWKDCLSNQIIVIGWDKLGDLTDCSDYNEVYENIKQLYRLDNPKMAKCAISDFVSNMKVGDIIIAKKGLKTLLGYGIVTSDYYFDNGRNEYKHCRKVDWKKVGEWINNTDTGNPIKTLTEISQYPGYPEELLRIINGGNNMNNNVTEWIIPANQNIYDHDGAFRKFGYIDWTQKVKYKVGDRVFLYCTLPEGRIKYLTEVVNINITFKDKLDDSEFNKGTPFGDENSLFTRLKLIKIIQDDRLTYEQLIKNGLKGNVQSPMRISKELSSYIHYVMDGTKMESINKIYYGGPGCGKSFLVNKLYCKNDGTYIRTTFYPDYTNSDFIGQLIPKYDKESQKLTYDIQAGPFTKALELSLKPENLNKNIYLIIEEINRGNAAAIFGDIFQLLDRNDKGESEFKISNYIIEQYIKENVGKNIDNSIKIPTNLSIIATMNTSDQNVYTLDSAFKRRWKMEYVTNKFGISDISKDYDSEIGDKNVPMLNLDIKWKDFIYKINKAIIEENTFGINSEDKQLGKYFVGSSDLISKEIYETKSFDDAARRFAEKVLSYIWEDISKLNPSNWFREDIRTFEKLLSSYQTDGINVFSENIKTRLNSDINE